MVERLSILLDATGAEWILWLLIFLSVSSVAVIIERFFFLQKRKVDIDELSQRIAAADNSQSALLKALGTSPGMEVLVGRALVTHRDRPRQALEDLYAAIVERERMRYERAIGFLATLGSNAPFIGLLGTVIGIIAAFADLETATKGANRAQLIMGNISEALVATAVGLFVAIPAVMAYNAFQRKIERSVGGTEVVAKELMSRFESEN